MNTQELLKVVKSALEDIKAKDIKVLDVSRISNFTDMMVIASGQSNRQIKALADRVIEQAKAHGHRPLGSEGQNSGEWVLVDLGNIVVHMMQPQTRDFYQLEKLWEDMHTVPSDNFKLAETV